MCLPRTAADAGAPVLWPVVKFALPGSPARRAGAERAPAGVETVWQLLDIIGVFVVAGGGCVATTASPPLPRSDRRTVGRWIGRASPAMERWTLTARRGVVICAMMGCRMENERVLAVGSTVARYGVLLATKMMSSQSLRALR